MDSAAGGGSESNWNTFSTAEDPEIMALLYESAPYSDEMHHQQGSMELPLSMYCVSEDHEMGTHADYYNHNTTSNDCNSTITGWSQGCGGNSTAAATATTYHFLPPPPPPLHHHHHNIESYYLTEPVTSEITNGCPIPMDFFTMEAENNNVTAFLTSPAEYFLKESSFSETTANGAGVQGDSGPVPDPISPPNQKSASKRGSAAAELKKNSKNATAKKKSKVSSAPSKHANGKSVQSKKAQKSINSSNPEECNNNNNSTAPAALTTQNSASFSSEDDSSSVQLEINDGEENSAVAAVKGGSRSKTRAGRGSATDPQSLYARKRRERINERLKILQNLIPNGTKVDISTMLEEAVEYVKFLQLQIKLLSSDDKWMYAPIAYNGMDIGLDLKISPPE